MSPQTKPNQTREPQAKTNPDQTIYKFLNLNETS